MDSQGSRATLAVGGRASERRGILPSVLRQLRDA